jgi:ketosteroid isomerase-like protein
VTFRQVLHRHLQALERGDANARLYATPLEIHEGEDSGFAVLHLLYCETPPGGPTLTRQSHLTLVFEKREGAWIRVQGQDSPIGI